MEKNNLYIPKSSNDPNAHLSIVNMIKDIENKKRTVEETYKNKMINLQNTVYYHNQDDKRFEKELSQAREAYLEMENQKFLERQKQQDKELEELNQRLAILKSNDIDYNNSQFLSVKSLYNNQNLSLIPNGKTHMIRANNQCLSVNTQGYQLDRCNRNKPSQQFNILSIKNHEGYYGMYNKQANSDQSYPFNILKSQLNGSCLESVSGGIKVKPCQDLEAQKWIGLKNKEIKCFEK